MAEQQLEIPSSWLPWDEDAIPLEPHSSALGRPLQHVREQRNGSDTVIVTGASNLCIEVRPSSIMRSKHAPHTASSCTIRPAHSTCTCIAGESCPATVCLQVNLGTGALERWEVAGHALLAAGVTPCLFRAPLDNDLGGSGKTSFASRCL